MAAASSPAAGSARLEAEGYRRSLGYFGAGRQSLVETGRSDWPESVAVASAYRAFEAHTGPETPDPGLFVAWSGSLRISR